MAVYPITKKPELSIVIAGRNEERAVESLLIKVSNVLKDNQINGEIVFLDDHSNDKTGEIADQLAKVHRALRVVHRSGTQGEQKVGVGNSIREGFRIAEGEYILCMDCDSHRPEDVPDFFKQRNDADIIIGSRFIKGGGAEMPVSRWILTGTYNLFVRLLFGLKIKDITSGFKLYSRKMLDRIEIDSEGFGIHAEITLKALLLGFKIKEIPIHYEKSPKKSTLIYRKQFLSYIKPIIYVLKKKICK